MISFHRTLTFFAESFQTKTPGLTSSISRCNLPFIFAGAFEIEMTTSLDIHPLTYYILDIFDNLNEVAHQALF